MSAGGIALTAILVSGAEGFALIAAVTWLVYTKRIMLAATPKAPAQQPASTAGQPPAGGGGKP